MRLATKNEILILMGGCVPLFAAHCVSSAGATTKFLFDNATSFDLDSNLVSGMIAQLNTAGIIDADCLSRFAAFGLTAPGPQPSGPYRYRVRSDFQIPDGAIAAQDLSLPDYIIITSDVAIDGLGALS